MEIIYEQIADQFVEHVTRHHGMHYDKLHRFSKGAVFALNWMADKDGAISPKEICRVMGISPPRVSHMLSRLEDKGLIERHIRDGDRRKTDITLTEQGKALVLRQRSELRNHLVNAFRQMGSDDTMEFIRLTARFSQIMGEATCQTEGGKE
jgi:DNA-binding MarR family transcriptional regulator